MYVHVSKGNREPAETSENRVGVLYVASRPRSAKCLQSEQFNYLNRIRSDHVEVRCPVMAIDSLK